MKWFRRICGRICRRICRRINIKYITRWDLIGALVGGVLVALSMSPFLSVGCIIAAGVCMTVVLAVCIEKIHRDIIQPEYNQLIEN